MSPPALRAVRNLRLPPTQKLVAFALADMANDYGESWPLNSTLIAITGLSERAVQGAVSALRAASIIAVVTKRGTSSRYFVNLDTPAAGAGVTPAGGAPPPAPPAPLPPQQVRVTPAGGAPRSTIEAKEEAPSKLDPPTPFGTDLLAAVPAPPDLVGRAIGIWNDVCGPFCGRVQKMTEQRRRRMRTVIVNEFHGSMEDWLAFCDGVAATPFLVGTNDRGWVADFDWMLTPANFVKVSEGKYSRSGPAVGASALRRELGLGFLDDAPAFEGVTLNGD